MKKIITLITLIILIKSVVQTISAQAIDNNQSTIINKIDSLRQVIKTAKHDTTRINAYILWCDELILQNPDSTLALEFIAKEIAEKLLATHPPTNVADTAKKQLSFALNGIGYIFNLQGDIPKALEYYNKSLNIQEEIGDKKGMAMSFNNIGMIYYRRGDIPKALEYFNKSLNIDEEIVRLHPELVEGKKGMAYSFNNIGMIYKNQGDIPKALEYYNKSLNIHKVIDDKQGMAASFNNIGQIYSNQASEAKSRQDFVGSDSLIKEALEYYNRSLNIKKVIGDKQGMAMSFSNIGYIYNEQASVAKSRQDFVGSDSLIKKALEYCNKSLNIREEIGDKKGMAESFNNIGSLYFEKNDIARAKSYIEKGYKLSKELGYPQNIENSARMLKKIYKKQGNYKLAYEFYTEEILMHDSIQNEENFKKAMQQHAKYEYEKAAAVAEIAHTKAMEIKDLQMAKIEEEKKKQRVIIMFVVCGLLLVAVFSVFLFRLFMQKKKANLILARQKQHIEIQNSNLNQANEEITAQRDEITAQRDEITAQRDLVTQQKEHIEEIHKEVTDSINYAKRIQEAMLPALSVIASPISVIARNEAIPPNISDNNEKIASCLAMTTPYEFETFILFRPKDVVSGDFYWFSQVNEYQIYAVADCTGHGVPGAFMSMLGISFLNEIVRKKEVTQASHVLDQLRVSIIDALRQTGESGTQKDGMDMSLVVIKSQDSNSKFQEPSSKLQEEEHKTQNTKQEMSNEGTATATSNNKQQTTNTLHAQWAGANNPLWVIRGNLDFPNFQNLENLVEVKPDKMPIAIYERMEIFTNHEIELSKGDILFLMSDGYEDQFGGPKGKKFLSKNLKELIISNCLLTMVEQKQILEKTLDEWIGEGEQIDDITLLGIKI